MTLDPDQVDADEETAAWLASNAALVARFYEDLRDQHLPESLCIGIVRDWHAQFISPLGVEWESDE